MKFKLFKRVMLSERGQGILETVIALSVIITGLVGALALAVNNLSSTSDSGMRIVAGNLAREGVEVVRSLRDSNWLAGDAWDQGLFSVADPADDHTATVEFREVPPFGENFWTLNFNPDTITQEQAKLKINSSLYTHSAGETSNFSRLLTLDEICDDGSLVVEADQTSCVAEGKEKSGIRVLSEVRWHGRGRDSKMVIEDRLYNWK